MIVLLNSSKTMQIETPSTPSRHSQPVFLKEARQLVRILQGFSQDELARLMSISEKLADRTARRYRDWKTPFRPDNAVQALLAFRGDVFADLQLGSYTDEDYAFAQRHVRILSGIYGLLRPLDLIQPYRLEMAYKLRTEKFDNLYDFWRDKISGALQGMAQEQGATELVNLASAEYLRAVNTSILSTAVITPVFKEKKGDRYKSVTVYVKRARGQMCDFIIGNRIRHTEDIKAFDRSGYRFVKALSSEGRWVFGRG